MVRFYIINKLRRWHHFLRRFSMYKSITFSEKNKIYQDYLKHSCDTYFTIKEIEVISCIVSNRSNQSLAQILGMSSSTVGAHIFNIRSKLKHIPRNRIIDFVERSGKLKYFKCFYMHIILEKCLIQTLNKIALITKTKPIFYKLQSVYFDPEDIAFLNQIKAKLEIANIHLEFTEGRVNEELSKVKVCGKASEFEETYKSGHINIFFDKTKSIYLSNNNSVLIDFGYNSNHYKSLLALIAMIPNKEIASIISLSIKELDKVFLSLSQDIRPISQSKKKIILTIVSCSVLIIIAYVTLIRSKNNEENSSITYQSKLSSSFKESRLLSFVGRENYLKELAQKLKHNNFVVVHGLQGVGKSSLVMEYGYKELEKGKTVIWFNASDEDKIYREFYCLAQEVDIETKSNREVVLKLLYKKIAQFKTEMLFIFDDVKHYQVLRYFLTNLPHNVKVIATSRNSNLTEFEEFIPILLQPFTKQEATIYLERSFKNIVYQLSKKINYDLLIKEVGLLPYNLSNVVGYMRKNKLFDANEYIKIYQITSDTNNLLVNNLQLDSIAWKILKYAVYLDIDFIDTKIFSDLLKISLDNVIEAIEELEKLSLVKFIHQKNFGGIKLHDLVKNDMKKFLQKNNISEQEILVELIKYFNSKLVIVTPGNNIPGDINYYMLNVIPQAVKVLTQVKNHLHIESAQLALKLGQYYHYGIYDFTNARKWYELSYKISQNFVIDNKLLYYWNNLLLQMCINYHELGEVEKVMHFSKDLLNITNKLYGSKNTFALADAFNVIGMTHFEYGQLKEALKYYKKALKTAKNSNENYNSFQVLKYLNNLSTAYYGLGDIETGIIYNKQAIEIAQKLEISPGRGTVISLINISYAYFKIGDFSKSLQSALKALSIGQEIFKNNPHRFFAKAHNAVGLAYLLVGNWDKSFEHFTASIEIYQKLLGNRPYAGFAQTLNNIAAVCTELGKIEEAIRYYTQALNIYENLFDNTTTPRPEFALIKSNLSYVYAKKGNYKLALTYSEQAIKIYNDLSINNNNIEYAIALHRLAICYYGLGKNAEGLKFAEKALRFKIAYYNNKFHPEIAESLYLLHMIYSSLGDSGKSALYRQQAYVSLRNSYNKTHPKTKSFLSIADNIRLLTQGEFDELLFITSDLEFPEIQYQIRVRLQSTLNKIQKLSSNGNWDNSYFLLKGVKDYLNDSFLREELKELANNENLILAKKLCLEAINIGILSVPPNARKFDCATRFIEENIQLTKELLDKNPEYFIDYNLLKFYNLGFKAQIPADKP